MFQTLFSKKIPFCPFWPKIVQNWPFGWMCVSLRAGISEKPDSSCFRNRFQASSFRITANNPYIFWKLGPVENFLTPPPPPSGGGKKWPKNPNLCQKFVCLNFFPKFVFKVTSLYSWTWKFIVSMDKFILGHVLVS